MRIEEILIGIALGLGYATKLRFMGKVGPSEILMFIATAILFIRNYRSVFSFSFDLKGFIKFYLFVIIFLIAPIMTGITMFFTDYKKPLPAYFLSFALEYILAFSLVRAYSEGGLDVKRLVYFYATTFIGLNLLLYFFLPREVGFFLSRFEGLAKNPNQLAFYAVSLIVSILVIFRGFKRIVLFILSFLIIYLSGSDAAMLAVVISIFIYLLMRIFDLVNLKYYVRLSLILLLIFLGAFYIWTTYKDYLVLFWYQADEGAYETGGRLALWHNAIKVISEYPIFGLGYGSFSGFSFPFKGWEAHNTFLDLSMQFGIVFSLIFYFFWFYVVLYFYKLKEYALASFLIGYILLGFFHFYARHFNFWFEFSLLYYYVFYRNGSFNETDGKVRCV